MKKYNLIKEKIEMIFRDLKIKYEDFDFDDEDLNYIITFDTYGKLKSLNSITGILYLHCRNFSMNFIVPNIYMLNDEENNIDTLDIYEVVNDINSEVSYGSFLIKDNKCIYYRSAVSCKTNYSDLTNELLKMQLDNFIESLAKLFKMLNDKEQGDE